MSQILFRGKIADSDFRRLLIDNSEGWVYGDVLHDYDGVPRAIADCCGSNPVEPGSIGQYVGLLDLDRKKVFTGDISMDLRGGLWVVFDCAGGFGTCSLSEWMKKDRTAIFLYEGLSDPQNASWFTANHKVVGSIHDRDLREFIGCDRSVDDYVRAREILRARCNEQGNGILKGNGVSPIRSDMGLRFTGMYDGTKWDDLTPEEQLDWLAEHSAADWKGRPIFEGDVVTLDGERLVKAGLGRDKAPLDDVIQVCEGLSKNRGKEGPSPAAKQER